MKETNGQKVFRVINAIILVLVVAITLFPFLNIVAQSFSSTGAITAGKVGLIPNGFNIRTYQVVMSDKTFWINYWNTLLYTVVGTAISVALTTMYAYVISKPQLKGVKIFTTLAVFTMFFSGGMIPTYLLVKQLHMINTMWAVILPGALSVYNMLIMKAFFQNLPVSLEEAAEIDGLDTFGILWKIVLPLSKPIIATMILFYAVANWNAWFGAFLYLDKKELFPVTIYLRNLMAGATSGSSASDMSADSQQQVNANIKAVTMVLTVLPILCVYPFVQKYFVTGIMLGSVKE
ncbi:carbohydrate ABC transporter permease [Schleiferilactobacillus harbinensis]|uniref:Carbohydrate ABC transporter permease n=1 Tax=Schleiferilactobacillus harbinensis TaxID=304207 RepID=A0ABU7T3J7_9LACO